MTEQKEMVRLCLKKALEIVDAVNAVPYCEAAGEIRIDPLYARVGIIKLEVAFRPPCLLDEYSHY
jgi:hypothetical protein